MKKSRSSAVIVTTNGRTVWLDDIETGCLVARFCPVSVEICPEVRRFVSQGEAWDWFVSEAKGRFDIDISEDLRPQAQPNEAPEADVRPVRFIGAEK